MKCSESGDKSPHSSENGTGSDQDDRCLSHFRSQDHHHENAHSKCIRRAARGHAANLRPDRRRKDRRHRPGDSRDGRRGRRRRGSAPPSRRDRRPGSLPRARPDSQGRPAARQPGLRQGRRDDLSGDAQYESQHDHAGAAERKTGAGRRTKPGQLRLLHRRDARQSGRTEAGPADAGHQDFHRLQHRRFAGRRPGRAGADLRRNELADLRPLRRRDDRAGQPAALRRLARCRRSLADSRSRSGGGLDVPRVGSGLPAPAPVSRAARFDRGRSGLGRRSPRPDHRRGLPASLVFQHRRLPAVGHAGADEPVGQDQGGRQRICGKPCWTAASKSSPPTTRRTRWKKNSGPIRSPRPASPPWRTRWP